MFGGEVGHVPSRSWGGVVAMLCGQMPVRCRSGPSLALFGEGIPAAGYECGCAAVLFHHQQLSLSGDFSNGGETHTSKGLRQELCLDRKSTRLNSSHLVISYAVFCLKKKKKQLHSISLR